MMSHKVLRLSLVALACLARLSVARADDIDLADAAAAILAAYPDHIASASAEGITWRDSTVMRFGAVRPAKQFDAIVESSSLGEQFLFDYPLAPWSAQALPAQDPGRLRNRDFFVKMYGDCRRGEVQRKLRTVIWLPKTAPQRLQVTTVNGVDKAIEQISDEIEKLPPELRRAAVPSDGTFVCRTIAGSAQWSMHAYAAAIDLNAAFGPYWRWSGLSAKTRGAIRVPQEIVDIFERDGFIWGGKWFHVDGAHFEYRPEILDYARRRATAPARGDMPPPSAKPGG